jgi:hypothetical protein
MVFQIRKALIQNFASITANQKLNKRSQRNFRDLPVVDGIFEEIGEPVE